ncbi:MAG: cyclic nucleotide-binding domain-containing protein [Cyanobacteriota bacterium]|jgi:potassium efflux system protein
MGAELKSWLGQIRGIFNSIRFELGNSHLSLGALLQTLLYLLLIYVLTYYFNEFLKKRLLTGFILEKGVRAIVANAVSYSAGFLIFLIVLQTSGVNLSSLAVLGGALGFGIGLGLQDLTRNLVSGFTLLVERKVKIGDFVEFGDIKGYVREVSPRALVVKLIDGSSVIIPNSKLIESQVTNYHYETETLRLTLTVGVAYGSDPVAVTETLLLAAYSVDAILKTPPAQVIFSDFGDNALLFELWVWIRVPDISRRFQILSSLRFLVDYYCRQNGVTIAFPQRDLWLKNPEAIAQAFGREPAPTEEPSQTPAPAISVARALKSIRYFEGLNDLELRQLIEIGQLQTLYPEEVLFRECDPGDALYIVLSGQVEVYTEKLNRVLRELAPGEVFGELALLLGTPRSASVRALEKTVLFVIRHEHLERLLRRHPDFQAALLQALERHQEELRRRKQELIDKGLICETEAETGLMTWVQERLKSLFNF